MDNFRFEIDIDSKKIIFDSKLNGLIVNDKTYTAGQDGILVYDEVDGISANEVTCQLSTNTSTLIPALRVLGIKYNSYFDSRDVVNSQNDITFYWKRSRLAAFYNLFSTDGINLEQREPILRSAVEFLTNSSNQNDLFLPEERLKKLDEDCKLLGFYEGFPIFDAGFGLPQLRSRLGIHIGNESIIISTPLDKYQDDVYELAGRIEKMLRLEGFKKKNRVRFEKNDKILDLLGLS